MQNVALRLGRKEFRTFAHPPLAMLDVCRAHGLSATDAHQGLVWQVEGLSR
jgi:magnesium-protoporphyrin O-methyltransferase